MFPTPIDQGRERDELHALDVADDVRHSGGTPSDLAETLTRLGYGTQEKVRATQHFAGSCSHESAGDIGTLPTYPERRVGIDGSGSSDIRSTANASWKAIEKANAPEQFFDHGGTAVWIKTGPHIVARVDPITVSRMTHLLGEVGYWEKEGKHGPIPCRPPKPVSEHMVSDPHPRLPWLRRLVRVPVFDSLGLLVMQAGYHAESGLLLAPATSN